MSPVSMTIAQAAAVTGGTLRRRGQRPGFSGVSIDSRQVRPGQAFIAIVGERFDGHQFCSAAAEAGASLLVVDSFPLPNEVAPEVAVLQVGDTRGALALLAGAWRAKLDVEVVAITGSVGKTTTKELTRSLLSPLGKTHCNRGNFNNEIGLPLTLLSAPADTRYLVTELGMNAPGEIGALTDVARPDVGVITCIAPVHLEGLGSIEAVAAAKGELLERLRPGAWAVVPGDEALLEPALRAVAPERRVQFGESPGDQVRILRVDSEGVAGCRVRLSLRGEEIHFRLPLVGAHNARNAAAAAAVAMILGAPPAEVEAALELPVSLSHRSGIVAVGDWQVLDDCYNANPVAMRAALDTLRQLAGAKDAVAVLGEMLELGPEAPRFHREVGEHAARVGLAALITVGRGARQIARGAREAGMPAGRVVEVDDSRAAAEAAARAAPPEAWILVKASRGGRLEEVIEGLRELRRTTAGGGAIRTTRCT